MRQQYAAFEFLGELKGLEQAYTAVHTRIKHLKKRFKVFEFFEKLRVGIYNNHNTLVAAVTDEVLEAIDKSKGLVMEFNSYLVKLHEIIDELENSQVDNTSTNKNLMSYFNKDRLLEFANSSRENLNRIDFKVDKINLEISPLRQQSILKEDQAKSFKDDTMLQLASMEANPDNKNFFEYEAEWRAFLDELQSKPPEEGEQLFKQKLKKLIDNLKVIDLKIEEMRNSLKKSFFNSIMTSRDLIRNSGFIQLKIQNKCQTKKALIEKLMSGLKEDLKIFRVLKEFKTTYSKSRKEIERRAKFDYLIIGYLRIMIALIKEENQLRKWFLKENSTLLPQTFCPFLTNYLSEQIIKQLEVYFLNDTTIDELEEAQIKNFRQSLRTLDQDNVVFRLGELLEQYMACAESLSPIHQNLALGMHPEADLYQMGPQYQRPMKEECSQPHIYDVRRFSLKIRESDMVSLSNSSVFVNMGASLERSEDKYLNFTAEVERTFDAAYENGNRPTFVLSSFKQDLSANPSFALVN